MMLQSIYALSPTFQSSIYNSTSLDLFKGKLKWMFVLTFILNLLISLVSQFAVSW